MGHPAVGPIYRDPADAAMQTLAYIALLAHIARWRAGRSRLLRSAPAATATGEASSELSVDAIRRPPTDVAKVPLAASTTGWPGCSMAA
jgi:hypothetical protein